MYSQIAPYYDALHQDVQSDIQFLLTLLNEKPHTIIDLGCGSGRISIPLAAAGHTVWGVDNSAAMFKRMARNLSRSHSGAAVSIQTVLADLQAYQLPKQTNEMAILGYNTAMHFDQAGLQAILNATYQHLRADGELVIDLSNPFDLHQFEEESNLFSDEYEIEMEGRVVIVGSRMEIDQSSQSFVLSWRFEDKEQVIEASETFYYYFPHQLQLLLEESRFKLNAIYGDYLFSPFEDESDRLILLASKI
ncbi:MAG: class I SAM-dependent methyltransferase [Chloroflexota bacterium]